MSAAPNAPGPAAGATAGSAAGLGTGTAASGVAGAVSAPIVDVSDLAVRFGGVMALGGVSFSLRPATCMGLIGANGSGKSTLLASLSRMCHGEEQGDIRIGGHSIMDWTADRVARWGMARTFQTVRLVDDLDVRDNVMVGLTAARDAPRRWPWDRAGAAREQDRVADALRTVGVARHARRRPGELPYGLQRRVEIARAIVAGPQVLLLDEPTAGMTGRERAELGELFRRLAASGIAVLVVEHDVRFVTSTCDEAFALDAGRVVARGTPAEVIASPEVQQAYLGTGTGTRSARAGARPAAGAPGPAGAGGAAGAAGSRPAAGGGSTAGPDREAPG